MYTFTFYSFKGGVGRTMALVNVAAELVKLGRKVLVVDFDLEAPGLETYKQLMPEKPHPGIVEYVSEFVHSRWVPDIGKYIFEAKHFSAEAIGEKGGLWVMPAGRRDPTYRQMLVKLDWKRLYHDLDGFRFFEETKKAWKEEYNFDYVLIDSRTGDTDVLGICTRQLPDSVVLLFVPNAQNLAGLKNVCDDIRRVKEPLKEVRLHFVAANVPDLDDENLVLETQLKEFQNRLEFKELAAIIYRYENLDLLNQSIFVIDRPRSKLARAYQEFTKRLVKSNWADRDGALLWMDEYAMSLVPKIEYDVSAARDFNLKLDENKPRVSFGNGFDNLAPEERKKDPLNRVGNFFPKDVKILNKMAECRILRGDFLSAERVLGNSLKVDPSQTDALFWRAHCKINLGKTDEAAEDILDYFREPRRNRYRDMSVLSKLRDISPSRLEAAVDLLLAAPDHESRSNCIGFALCLSETEPGMPAAAKLMKKVVASLDAEERQKIGYFLRPPDGDHPADEQTIAILNSLDDYPRVDERTIHLLHSLVLARCWSEVIELVGEQEVDKVESFEAIAMLVIAFWAKTGSDKPPSNICRLALRPSVFGLALPVGETLDFWCWMHWGAGNLSEAAVALDDYEIQVHENGGGYGYSPWTYRNESVEVFDNHCQLVRRVLQGEPLRPDFLGPIKERAM